MNGFMEIYRFIPFFDCEIEGEDMTLEESETRIQLFVEFLCREINLMFGCSISQNDFILLNSNREGELPYHMVI
jgi:hypothetical protein